MEHLTWRTSSYSSDVGDCVEITDLAGLARPLPRLSEWRSPPVFATANSTDSSALIDG